MNSVVKRWAGLAIVIILVPLLAGCENPFIDSWSGQTVDDALITFEGETYDLISLQKMNPPPGNYDVIVGSPEHHFIETTVPLGSRDIPKIELTPYLRIYSPFVTEAFLCSFLNAHKHAAAAKWNYSSEDAHVIAYITWDVKDESYHYQTIRWYRPDGILYHEENLPRLGRTLGSPITTAPRLSLHQSPGWGVPPPITLPGIWVVEIIMDKLCTVKMSFEIRDQQDISHSAVH